MNASTNMNASTKETIDTLAAFPTLESVRVRLGLLGFDEPVRLLAEPVEGTPPRQALVAAAKALAQAGRGDDAVGVLAQALSGRAAVWWACRAARLEPGGGPVVAEAGALEIAEKWVRKPHQSLAYAAQEIASTRGMNHPSGCAAMCAFLAGESLAPAHLPPLPPAEHLAGMLAAGAVKLAVVRRDPARADATRGRLLEVGHAIAGGTDTWEER